MSTYYDFDNYTAMNKPRMTIKDIKSLLIILNAISTKTQYDCSITKCSYCLIDNTNTIILYGRTKSDLFRQLSAFIDGYKAALKTISQQ
jgi:hypothetical protein